MSISTSGLLHIMEPCHVFDGSAGLQALTKNIYSTPINTVFKLLEVDPGFNELKVFSRFFDDSKNNVPRSLKVLPSPHVTVRIFHLAIRK